MFVIWTHFRLKNFVTCKQFALCLIILLKKTKSLIFLIFYILKNLTQYQTKNLTKPYV
jgi:hypothetical protein